MLIQAKLIYNRLHVKNIIVSIIEAWSIVMGGCATHVSWKLRRDIKKEFFRLDKGAYTLMKFFSCHESFQESIKSALTTVCD